MPVLGVLTYFLSKKPVTLGFGVILTYRCQLISQKTCGAASYWLYNIKRISKFLSKENLISVIRAFVTSRLDYCNSILYGLPSSELIKLQRVQSAAARLVTSTPRYCHITPSLYELHWLPVKFRINFKLLLITFKALHGMAPKYIADLHTIRKKGNYSLRSNDSIILEYPKKKSLRSFGDRSFSVAATKLSFGMSFRRIFATFHQLMFLRQLLKLIFLNQPSISSFS